MPAPPDLNALFAAFNSGRYAQAEAIAGSMIDSNRASPGIVWKLLGAALWAQRKDAVPALERAADLLPDDAESHTNLGNALRRQATAAPWRSSRISPWRITISALR